MTTVADDACARALSLTLVGEHLAACVTRSAVRSVYRWVRKEETADGVVPTAPFSDVQEDDEVLLLIKTSRLCVEVLERRLRELHPYDCPELIRVAPEHVEPQYLRWLLESCLGKD